MTEYPDDLVVKVRSNRDAYNDLLQTQLGLDRELDDARISYEVSRNERNFGERIGGWAVKLVKKSTPTLDTMWKAEEDIKRLEGLLKDNSANQDTLRSETDGAISSYLAGMSELFQEYLAGRNSAAEAIGVSESYLTLVNMVKNDVDYLSWMVWRDWPYMRDPWGSRRRYPPRRCRPPRRWDVQMSRLEDEELSMGIRGNDEIGIMGFIGEDGEVDFMSDDYTGEDGMGAMDDDISILGLGIGLEDDDDDSRGSGGRGRGSRGSGGRGSGGGGGGGGMGTGLHKPEVPDFSPPPDESKGSRGSGGREKRGDDDAPVDLGFGFYDPKEPDFSPPDRRQPHRPPRRRPRRPCPPRRRYWHGYWWRRRWALQDAQDGVNRIKVRKPGYVAAMEQYVLNRSKHLNELPSQWYSALHIINASSVDDLPWYSAFHALPFMLTMDRVSSQLTPILENVRGINSQVNSDLSQLESKIAGEVARVRSEILND